MTPMCTGQPAGLRQSEAFANNSIFADSEEIIQVGSGYALNLQQIYVFPMSFPNMKINLSKVHTCLLFFIKKQFLCQGFFLYESIMP